MTDRDPEQARVDELDTVELVSRLLFEIRADQGWREALGPRAADAEAAAAEASEPADRGQRHEAHKLSPLAAPEVDAALDATMSALSASIDAAEEVVPIVAARPLVGDAWARLRRRIHAEIRIYQDRQSSLNREVLAALRRLEGALDARDPTAAVGSAWAAIGATRAEIEQLESRLLELHDELAERVRRLEARVQRLEDLPGRLVRLEARIAALEASLVTELEPVGQLRLAVAELMARHPGTDA